MSIVGDEFKAALQLHREGKLRQAEGAYRQILSREPMNADALRMLGNLRAQVGDRATALDLLRRAVAADPARGTFHFDLAHVLRQVGRPDEAVEHLRLCLSHRPDHAEAHHALGEALLARAQNEEALRHMLEAARLKPGVGWTHLGVARALRRNYRYPDALIALEHARRLDPQNPQIATETGRLHLAQGQWEPAGEAYGRAIALNPSDTNALAGMAIIHERANRLDEARSAADAALAIEPNQPGARLALAKVERREGNTEKALAHLEFILARPYVGPQLKAQTLVELGHVLDKLGRYPEAFDAFARGQRCFADMPRSKAYPLAFYPAYLDAYRALVESGPIAAWPRSFPGDSSPDPVFFVGFPRSGTTLTERILESHPNLTGSDEAPILSRVIGRTAQVLGGEGRYPSGLNDLTSVQVADLRAEYWRQARSVLDPARLQGKRLLDKLPLNLVELPVVRRLFPESRIIVALRDPRDCCLSCFFQDFEPNYAMVHFYDIETTARLYEKVMGLWLLYRERLGLSWIESRYEDLVADTEGSARRLIDFLGEPWDDAVLGFQARARERYLSTPSYQAVSEPIYKRAVERWRKYRDQLQPILPILDPFAREFGYAPA